MRSPRETAKAGKVLVERLAIYPAYARDAGALARRRRCARAVLRAGDAEGFARADPWMPGADRAARRSPSPQAAERARPAFSIARASGRERSRKTRSSRFSPRAAPDFAAVCQRRRRAARRDLRRPRELCRHPQHQLHQHLLFPLQVLRLLQGQAQRESARPALRSRARRDRAARARGVGARRGRGLPPGRHPSRIYRRDLSRDLPRDQAARCRACTSTPSRRSRSRRARRRSVCGRGIPRRAEGRRGSDRCPARRPRCSTTKCAPSSAPTR